jgi:hypothetical protein
MQFLPKIFTLIRRTLWCGRNPHSGRRSRRDQTTRSYPLLRQGRGSFWEILRLEKQKILLPKVLGTSYSLCTYVWCDFALVGEHHIDRDCGLEEKLGVLYKIRLGMYSAGSWQENPRHGHSDDDEGLSLPSWVLTISVFFNFKNCLWIMSLS